ncbi:UNVERIFIED_CONTAM: hypothetical protein Sangu_2159700 [Sesamum angustifolium]|uniref:Uncharacterized protein n=1 Tax=Sesamum angustifolium TaxID=2727405 RepID=A0AAW2LG64_9LAMI
MRCQHTWLELAMRYTIAPFSPRAQLRVRGLELAIRCASAHFELMMGCKIVPLPRDQLGECGLKLALECLDRSLFSSSSTRGV